MSDAIFIFNSAIDLAKRVGSGQITAVQLAEKCLERIATHNPRINAVAVLQADQGADLGFLRGRRGAFVPRDNH